MKCQCCPHIETIHLSYTAMRATLAFNGLSKVLESCNVTEDQYYEAVKKFKKNSSVIKENLLK